jgi:hypothetical protein
MTIHSHQLIRSIAATTADLMQMTIGPDHRGIAPTHSVDGFDLWTGELWSNYALRYDPTYIYAYLPEQNNAPELLYSDSSVCDWSLEDGDGDLWNNKSERLTTMTRLYDVNQGDFTGWQSSSRQISGSIADSQSSRCSSETCSSDDNLSDTLLKCTYPSCRSTMVFRRPCDLRKHQKRHSKTVCCRHTNCTSAFSNRKDRDRHEAKHRPSTACSWTGCTRVFSRMDNMVSSINVHVHAMVIDSQ